MGCIGNVIWIVFAGLLLAVAWCLFGLLWCLTIVGIPIGVQCFKFAGLMFAPFGKEIVPGTGLGSILLDILWLLFGGIEIAVTAASIGLVLCATIIGIPFGLQCFKIAALALMPFGSKVV